MTGMRAAVSVIKLMATISYFTWAQPPSVCTVQVRFIVSWVKTNEHSPRATREHTDHWAVGPSTLSELPRRGRWAGKHRAQNCTRVTVSRFDISLVLSLLANKSCSDRINVRCSGCCHHYIWYTYAAFYCGAGLIWWSDTTYCNHVCCMAVFTLPHKYASSLLHNFSPLGGSKA